MGLLASLRQAFGFPPAQPRHPPMLITPETRAALNVHLMAAASRANLGYRQAEAAAAGDPFGGLMATVAHERREALAGRLRRGEPVTVDEVVALANRDPSDPLNQALLHAVFLQQELQQELRQDLQQPGQPWGEHRDLGRQPPAPPARSADVSSVGALDGPRRLF